MVGGISADWAKTDVLQAQAMGVDAFALNVVTTTADWSNNAIKLLFDAAGAAGFKLFFSFDMTHFNDPSEFIGLLQQYYNHPAYYKPTGANYVSTFYGGTKSFGYSTANAGWQAKLKDAAKSKGINTYFVPAFDDAPVDPANFFTTFPVADGAFAWEQSWPWPSQGIANVSSTRDAAYLTAARKASKTYMMGIAPIQFKHMGSGANYIRRGGLNFALRIPQILSLGPDVVQIQSWNDAGESHYIGNVWSWALSGTNIGSYTDGYDHSAWQILLKPFVKAFKAGVTSVTGVVPTSGNAQGVFWHSTLMNTASCNGDPIGVPQNRNLMENKIEVAVMLASGVSGKINVFSGGRQIASYGAVAGLNMFEVPGMVPGTVRVEVRTNTGALMLSGSGSKQVLADSSNCNYNPQVVALA
jgi:glucan endo-1,3-alpha-glucosidase